MFEELLQDSGIYFEAYAIFYDKHYTSFPLNDYSEENQELDGALNKYKIMVDNVEFSKNDKGYHIVNDDNKTVAELLLKERNDKLGTEKFYEAYLTRPLKEMMSADEPAKVNAGEKISLNIENKDILQKSLVHFESDINDVLYSSWYRPAYLKFYSKGYIKSGPEEHVKVD